MARITVLGGSGYTGSAVVAEAARRGHEVTSVSRSTPDASVEGIDHVAGDARDAQTLSSEVEDVLERLLDEVAGSATRVGYVGGASSLQLEEGGRTLWDVSHENLPAEVKPEIETGLRTLDILKQSPESVDWFYVSPPSDFGAWFDTPSRGSYVLGGDVLLKDADGASTISAADLALAIVDEIERPAHRRARFTAIWGPA